MILDRDHSFQRTIKLLQYFPKIKIILFTFFKFENSGYLHPTEYHEDHKFLKPYEIVFGYVLNFDIHQLKCNSVYHLVQQYFLSKIHDNPLIKIYAGKKFKFEC